MLSHPDLPVSIPHGAIWTEWTLQLQRSFPLSHPAVPAGGHPSPTAVYFICPDWCQHQSACNQEHRVFTVSPEGLKLSPFVYTSNPKVTIAFLLLHFHLQICLPSTNVLVPKEKNTLRSGQTLPIISKHTLKVSLTNWYCNSWKKKKKASVFKQISNPGISAVVILGFYFNS